MVTSRHSRGNMIFLVSCTIALVIAIGIIGIMFNHVLLQRTRGQFDLDAITLSMASKINLGDRVGQINQLEEASRELVFTSRQTLNNCSEPEQGDLTKLSNLLLEDARAGHRLVENERRNQIAVIRAEMQDSVVDLKKNDGRGGLSFFFIHTAQPKIIKVELGRIVNVDSNVRSLDAIPELRDFDRRSGYVDSSSKLIKSNVNAKLPAPDSDLNFRFCALPAFSGKICSPPRNANAKVFKSYGTIYLNGAKTRDEFDEIPEAVQITSVMDVNIENVAKLSNLATVQTISTAACSGASAASE